MAGCKPNCCTQPRAAPWGNDVALIKVSRSVRATCIMRGNAPWGVKGINGLRAFGAWHFCASAKMPNVSIAVYVPPGRCPGLWATFGLTARPNHLPGVCANWFVFNSVFLTLSLRFSAALGNMSKLYCTRLHENSAALGIARTSSALHSLARKLHSLARKFVRLVRPIRSPF